MNKIVTTAPKGALLTRDNMDDLGEWLRREPGSREAFVQNATEALYAFHAWGGKIVTPEGHSINIVPGLFDDATVRAHLASGYLSSGGGSRLLALLEKLCWAAYESMTVSRA